MIGADEPTTGIPNADKPGWWVVPPWPVHASLCDVVNHFLCFTPSDNASVTEKLAYYKGYLTAIDAAPRHELKHHYDERWYEDLRDCIGRCVRIYQDKHATEIQRTNRTLRSLRPAARAAPTSRNGRHDPEHHVAKRNGYEHAVNLLTEVSERYERVDASAEFAE